MSTAKNVLGGPLQTCSMRPLTGFYRNGCCDTGPEDEGLHTICCQVTAEFLAHQREIGNDLSTPFPHVRLPRPEAGRPLVRVHHALEGVVRGRDGLPGHSGSDSHARAGVRRSRRPEAARGRPQPGSLRLALASVDDSRHEARTMRLDDLPESSNVADRRGMKMAGGIAAGGGGILLLILGLIFGVDTEQTRASAAAQRRPAAERQVQGVRGQGRRHAGNGLEGASSPSHRTGTGGDYENAEAGPVHRRREHRRVRHRAGRRSGRSTARRDKTMYLDPTFFDELEKKLGGSKAEFSQAYVIAHEIGHHVQNLLGFSARGRQARHAAGERVLGPAGTSGRLPRRRVGAPGQKKFNFIEPGDVDRRDQDGEGDRRRPAAEAIGRVRPPGEVQPRHARPAGRSRSPRATRPATRRWRSSTSSSTVRVRSADAANSTTCAVRA